MISLKLQSHLHDAIKPEHKTSAENRPESKSYEYSALPDDNHIRLLNIHQGTEAMISCSLEIVNLADYPEYDCLSYTWQDPRLPLFQSIAPAHYRRQRSINCDGSVLMVQQNLHDALYMLRSSKSDPESSVYTLFGKYIWIDAVCINQIDMAERAAQVQIMDNIYSGAQLVVAWLGKSCIYTEQAIKCVHYLENTAPALDETECLRMLFQQKFRSMLNPTYTTPLGQYPNVTAQEWRALTALVKLPYFERIWILQEVLLASEMLFVWGDNVIAKETVFRCAEMLVQSASPHPFSYNSRLLSSLQARMTKSVLHPLGQSIYISKFLKTNIYSGSNMPWYALLPTTFGRGFNASDPRDKVYATIPWVKRLIKSCPPTEPVQLSLNDIPKPDYTKSVTEVFTEFALWQMKISNSLLPLQNMEDPSSRSSSLRDTLPSWVPDLSVPPTIRSLWIDARPDKPWEPAGPHIPEVFGIPIGDGSLVIRGAYFDSIKETTVEFSKRPSTECLISTFKTLMPLLSSNYPGSMMSYVQALWRTLTRGKSATMDRAFNEWMIYHVMLSMQEWDEQIMEFMSKQGLKSSAVFNIEELLFKETMFQVKTNPEMFVENPFHETDRQLLEDFNTHQKDVYSQISSRSRRIGTNSSQDKSQDFWDILSIARLLDISQSFFTTEQCLKTIEKLTDVDDPDHVRLRQRVENFSRIATPVINGRRIFVTDKGYIGVAGKSVQVGDQVWLAPRLDTLMILRPLQNGKFVHVIDAYVHGIMHGEALATGGLQFQDIELV